MDKSPQRLSQKVASKIESIESFIKQKKFKEALAEIRDLESQRIIDQFSIESGHVHYLLSLTFHHLGRYEEGLSEGRKAFDLFKNTLENEKIAQIQFVLGNIYVALGDFEKAEFELRDALTGYRRVENKQGIITVYSKLANISFVNSEFDKAMKYLNQCIGYCDESGDETTKAILAANLSRIYILIGRWQSARESLFSVMKLLEEKRNELALSRAFLSLGYVSCLQRNFKKANKYYEQALKIIFENNYTREFAVYHEYAGELYFAQGKYDEAKNRYREAIAIGEKIAPEGDIISQTYRLLAELQIAEKQYDEAMSSCEKALKVAISLGEKIEIGAIHRALGQIYTAKKEKAKAKESFKKSISILEQIGAKFELGKAYLEAGESNCFDFFERVQYLGRAKGIFEELDSGYHEGLVQLAISKLLFDNEELEKSLLFLNDAEKIFKELEEDKELSSILSLRKIIERASGKSESTIDAKSRYTFSYIITQNQKMLDLLEKVKRVKDSDLTILLEGETGTGKDLLAKTIHYESKRKNRKFVVAQCSAIPDTLLENALFGHAKGAYTGATESSVGLFEEASGGTLYLDEIAEIPLSTQVKLLRAIDEKEITRIGETKPRKIDVRIISSTSRNLTERVSGGLFRQDLYFRLNALSFKLPPLRERKEDIFILMEHFLKENGWRKDAIIFLDNSEFVERVREYDWPGNVRELKHEIEKLVALTETMDEINLDLWKERFNQLPDDSEKPSLYEEVTEFEKTKIIKALEQSEGNKSQAAKMLGIPEATLWNKLKKYKIE